MPKTFEVCWKLDGTATVEATTMEEAIKIAEQDLTQWSGFGLDVINVSVDGIEVFD
jgi:hypothetical protein